MGDWATRLMVLAATANFLVFFARDIVTNLRYGRRQLVKKTAGFAARDSGPRHRCTVCGITEQSHPEMDFRYCPQCNGQFCYCRDHVFSHQHKK